jgi:Zn-dependent peptidase ImmA (M78 family)
MPKVNPVVLTWARETAGLSRSDAARALGFKDGKTRTAEGKLADLEAGTQELSRPQLLKMTKVYRRPLLAFYLETPPKAAPRGEDFRTLPAERAKESAAEVEMLVRDVQVRQNLVRSALEDAEEAEPHRFVGSARLGQDVRELAGKIRAALEFDLAQFRARRTVEEAFSYLRERVEHTGVFVLLIGNLGSHHSNISSEVFRGFALADEVAPFVVINDQDAKAAWSFTLLHELVHIWLGQTGISGGWYESRVEQFCNMVASELLLPAEELRAWNPRFRNVDELVAQITEYANERKISRAMVNYRLRLADVISDEVWDTTARTLRETWLRERAAAKQQNGGGGPSYYVVRRHRVGGALLELVKRSLQDGVLTPTKAGRVLGVKPTNIEPLLESA